MPRIPTVISQQPQGRQASGASTQLKGRSQTKEQFKDRQQNAMQEYARAAVAPTKALPFADGNMIAGVVFTAGTTVKLQHNLGRKFVGYILCNQRRHPVTGATLPLDIIRIENTDSRLDAVQIQLASDGAYVADVWVY